MFGKDFLEGGYNPEQFDIQMDAQGNTLLVPKRPIQANPLESLSQLGGAMTQGAGGLAELVGELSGVAGTADVLSGEGEPLDYLDALGLAADIGTPGIPLTPMIAGLGMADSIPRLAGKIDARSLGGVVDAVKNILGELVTAGHVTTESDIDILGDAIQKMDSFRIDPMTDEVRQVSELFSPGGEAFPAGVHVQASRGFNDPTEMRIPGFFDASGETGRDLENTLGAKKVAKTLRTLEDDFAGVEKARFQRVGGVAKADERRAIQESGFGTIDDETANRLSGRPVAGDGSPAGGFLEYIEAMDARVAAGEITEEEARYAVNNAFPVVDRPAGAPGTLTGTPLDQDEALAPELVDAWRDAAPPGSSTDYYNQQLAAEGLAEGFNTPFADAPPGALLPTPKSLRTLDLTKRGEQALQSTDPFRDFLFTVLSNTRGSENLQTSADQLGMDLLSELMKIKR